MTTTPEQDHADDCWAAKQPEAIFRPEPLPLMPPPVLRYQPIDWPFFYGRAAGLLQSLRWCTATEILAAFQGLEAELLAKQKANDAYFSQPLSKRIELEDAP